MTIPVNLKVEVEEEIIKEWKVKVLSSVRSQILKISVESPDLGIEVALISCFFSDYPKSSREDRNQTLFIVLLPRNKTAPTLQKNKSFLAKQIYDHWFNTYMLHLFYLRNLSLFHVASPVVFF